jgi:hypothetical protein
MTVSPEWLLAAALVAIYLLDSVHFLQIGEAVVSTRGATLRGLSFGSSFELGGRRPYLPNPLTPWRPDLRVDWHASLQGARPGQVSAEMQRQLHVVSPIARIASGCAALVVVVAPLALVGGYERTFTVSILVCLLCAAAGCVLVIRRRAALGLTLWQAISVSLVALICPPCSGNLGRAAAIQRRWVLQASDLPNLDIEAANKTAGEAQVREMLTRALRLCVEDGAEHRSIASQLSQLEAKQGPDERH